jgi:hypothetical protein
MAGKRDLTLRVLGDAKNAVQSMSALDRAMGGFTKTLGLAGAAFGALTTGALGAMAYKSIQLASDLAETQSKVGVIFGDSAEEVRKFASTAAGALGQSKQTALDGAATFGIFGKAAGLAGQDLASFSTDFVKLAADLASFNNTTPQDAIQAIGAALRGESEPLRRYGVLLNDATLRQQAMEMGIYSGSGALTSQQKILAATELIFKQTSDAQGDFSRTSDGLANQQRILSASIQNLKTSLGEVLLPAFLGVVRTLNTYLTPAVAAFADNIGEKGIGQATVYAIAAMGELAFKFIDGLETMTLAVLKVISTLINLAQTIGLVIAAAAALKGDFVTFAKSSTLVLALDAAETKLGKTTKALPGYFDSLRNSVRLAQQQMQNATPAITQTADRLEAIAAKAKAGTPPVDEFDKTLGGAAKTVETAKEKLAKFTNALRQQSDAQRDAQRAAKNTTKAQTDYLEATLKVQAAQEAFNRALAGFGEDSAAGNDAAREEAAAERSLERAGYDVEQARFAIIDAEKELAKARKEGDPVEIRKAEIRLAESRLSVVDSTDRQIDAQRTLTKAQDEYRQVTKGVREGDEKYRQLLSELNKAKEAQETAAERVTAAKEAELDATLRLAEAEQAYQEVLAKTPAAIVKRAQAALEAARAAAGLGAGAGGGAGTSGGPAPSGGVSEVSKEAERAAEGVLDLSRVPAELVPGVRPGGELDIVTGVDAAGNPTYTTVNVTVNAGMGTDGQQVAREIVDLLVDYERLNGYIPVTSQYALAV